MNTMQKIKVELEYIINTSPNILFTCLSTPSGLSEWFANDVNIKDDTFTFFWDQSEESAKLMKSKKDSIRFQWEDDEGEDYYFQMAIKIDDLTKDVALLVTDFAEDDEVEEIRRITKAMRIPHKVFIESKMKILSHLRKL